MFVRISGFVRLVAVLPGVVLLMRHCSSCLGIMTDVLVYSVIIPVLPFQLRSLGYSGVPKLGGWVAFAYVSLLPLLHFYHLSVPSSIVCDFWPKYILNAYPEMTHRLTKAHRYTTTCTYI
jgi:hypothetical protein